MITLAILGFLMAALLIAGGRQANRRKSRWEEGEQ